MCVIKICWLKELSSCRGDLIPAESKEVKGERWLESQKIWKNDSAEGPLWAKKLRAMGKTEKSCYGSNLAQLQYHPSMEICRMQGGTD